MLQANRLDRGFLKYQSEFEEAALRVLRSGWYILGQEVSRFEEEFASYCGSEYCVGLASGLDALWLAFRVLGVGEGDEVIVQGNTYIASVMGISINNATPVFVEPDEYYGLDADRIRIKPGKFFAINGSKTTIKLGELVKDDEVKVRFKASGDSERALTPTNAEVTDGELTTADVDTHEATLKVIKNGVVGLTTGNGFQFLAITINADLPEVVEDGISMMAEKSISNGAIYNLAGQQVSKAQKGVYIIGGKKFVVK